MKSKLIDIGNSKGVRLPKAILEQAELTGSLEISVVDDAVVIRRSTPVRAGWSAAAAACGDVTNDVAADWDGVAGDGQGA